ncbi:MAG: AAA family ATPase, partial [Promethearchaeota archaeon]
MVLNDDLGPTIPQDPITRFEDFLRLFEFPVGTFFYMNKIRGMLAEGTKSLYVDFSHLTSYDIKLARDLHENPSDYLDKANQALVNILHEKSNGSVKLTDKYFIRFSNLSKSYKLRLRKIRADHLEKLYSISGSLIRSTSVRPQIVVATFECKVCGAIHAIEQIDRQLTYPSACNIGGCKNSKKSGFRLIGKSSQFIDWQQVRIQETPEELTSGNVPRFLDCLLTNDIVDTCRPGDRITVVGVIKIIPKVTNTSNENRVFQTLMHVNNIYSEEDEIESLEITEEDEKKIKELSKLPDIHDRIISSIAPDIYGRDKIKQAAALVLFGGVQKLKQTGHKIRGDIHILVMGDPGTGKSQIIKSVSRLAPRAIYTSGQGSTAAGLTAAVLREESTGSMMLEAGALVLADGGIAAIDEFDKMKTADRVAIHEAMEQQSYHPRTEILLANGERIRIGPFVDALFEKHPDQIIEGKNCQILPVTDLTLYSTDFNEIFKIPAHRVSRHLAPDFFYKISFSNGRHVIVTPEHPVFIRDMKENKIKVIEARNCKRNMLVPAPSFLPNSSAPIQLQSLTDNPELENNAQVPLFLTGEIASLIGDIMHDDDFSEDSLIRSKAFSRILNKSKHYQKSLKNKRIAQGKSLKL